MLCILHNEWEDAEEVENVRSKPENVNGEYKTNRNCVYKEVEKNGKDGEHSRVVQLNIRLVTSRRKLNKCHV